MPSQWKLSNMVKKFGTKKDLPLVTRDRGVFQRFQKNVEVRSFIYGQSLRQAQLNKGERNPISKSTITKFKNVKISCMLMEL